MRSIQRILIIRFSSIGDIVLTSPTIRSLRKAYPDAELHYVTKQQFAAILEPNPYLNKVHVLGGSFSGLLKELRSVRFDVVIDLHRSLRSRLLCFGLLRPTYGFPKLNIRKWFLVRFKIDLMPPVHIAERYMHRLKPLQVYPDSKGLDYFLTHDDQEIQNKNIRDFITKPYIAVVAGAKHYTKQIPVELLAAILKNCGCRAIILGGPDEQAKAEELIAQLKGQQLINTCGKLSLGQSAWLIKSAEGVLSSDTGLMHIAAAFRKNIVSVWGNTVPELGMTPYLPGEEQKSAIFEVKKLSCRPCSKIGFDKCPKGHFRCMMDHNPKKIADTLLSMFSKSNEENKA